MNGRARVALVVLLAALPARAMTGAELYAQACASCNGADGRGAPAGTSHTVPLPDFTDCATATAETTANWAGLVRHGGPFLGLSAEMPAFGDVLTEAEIRAVIAYVRGFCRDPRWPIGDLEYRRAVFVEKAFPEDEVVLSYAGEAARRERTNGGELALEKRIGPRGWLELDVPGAALAAEGEPTRAGLGDLALVYRQALVVAPAWRSIGSAGVEVALPTGNRRHGVGSGTFVVAPELLSGHALGPLVVQTQVLAELPADAARADRRMVYRAALQWPLGPYKKDVVPALEIEQSQALASAVHAATLLGPSLYVPLSRRGHVACAVGALLPVAGTRPFDWQLGAFLLWEYSDGPFWAW